jgi:hypothetical protein
VQTSRNQSLSGKAVSQKLSKKAPVKERSRISLIKPGSKLSVKATVTSSLNKNHENIDKVGNLDNELDATVSVERTLEEIKAENKANQLKLKVLKQVSIL